MTFDESENMSFQLSRVEILVKGFVSKGDLDKSMQASVKTWDLANL